MIKYSCKMLTAGRVHLLEEALFSFLNMERSEEAELIIVNDYPYQKLIFDHPRIKIINSSVLFHSIGEKDIYAHDLCQGDIVLVFDDDDIALPNHLNNIDKYLQDNDILHWGNAGFYNESSDEKTKPSIQFTQIGNSGIVYPMKSYIECGKSPIMNEGGDMKLVKNLKALRNKSYWAMPENKDISWLYRWSLPKVNDVGCYHQSGMGDEVEGRDPAHIRNFNYLESLRKKNKLPVGNIILKPKWRRDYVQLVKSHL